MKKAIMSVLTVWILVSSMFIGLISFSDIDNVKAPYVPHDPIRINSDAEFATMAGIEGWVGDGSPGNPYIIEGYDINGSGYGYCIYIGNTTVYFEMNDSYLHEASGVWGLPYYSNSGIILCNVQNGIIDNNTISSNNYIGIYLHSSSNNTIANNTASSNNNDGIYLYYSSNNTITNNNASNNFIGMYLELSNNNTIANNTASDAWCGISLLQSNNNTVVNNSATSESNYAFYIDSSNNNTIENNNGGSNNWIGFYLYSSNNNLFTNNNASNNFVGICFELSNSNTIANNTASDGDRGIILDSSSSNNITNNTASLNKENGIYIYQSSNNTIVNNIASSNLDVGIYILSSNSNTITDNNASQNNGYGIFLSSSNGNIITINNISNNKNGIHLDYSNNNTISNNIVSSNSNYGIFLSFSSSDTITNNEVVDDGIIIGGNMLEHWNTHQIDTTNTVNGRPVHYWKNQTGGTIPLDAGQVILANSTNVKVEYQNLSSCDVGIQLGFSNYNTIVNNTILSNDWCGIRLSDSNNNTIINNNASNNREGFLIFRSTGNTITNNNASNNWNGISLYTSNWNTITQNTAFSNTDYGIYLWDSSHNTITKNNAYSNDEESITLDFSNNNTIANNTISNNKYGISIRFSIDNKIYHNNIINNTNQAIDNPDNGNQWDNGYPTGGNYWSDYVGFDEFKGPNQNIPGSDGIGDTNYSIDSDSVDNYPLMNPIGNLTFLYKGWNLISIPSIQPDSNLGLVLSSINGSFDAVQWFNSSDSSDPWKHHQISKPSHLNDLTDIDHIKGFWIHITEPGGVLFEYFGTQPTSNQSIPLHTGWNMVGYPTLTNRNRTAALNNLTFGLEVDAIWTFNAANKNWEEISGGDYFEVGRGYWIHATQECVWEVAVK